MYTLCMANCKFYIVFFFFSSNWKLRSLLSVYNLSESVSTLLCDLTKRGGAVLIISVTYYMLISL